MVEFDENTHISKNELSKIEGVQKVRSLEQKNTWLLEASSEKEDLRNVVSRYAAQKDWLILSLKSEEKTLEQVFKELTAQ